MVHYFVKAEKDRPDFRLVITFLWSDDHDVDTDGDSYNPASHTWTELYVCNRNDEGELVQVTPEITEPLILRVESDLEYLAARTAYFLAARMGSGVGRLPLGPFEDRELLLPSVGVGFDIAAAMQRVESSPFSRATLDDPYPNLRELKFGK